MRKLFLLAFLLLATGLALCQTPMQLLHTIESPFENDLNSWSGIVKGNADINGDGYNDIIIAGRPMGSAHGRRDVYIYLGGEILSNTPDFIITDPATPGPHYLFGSSIAYNGDLNGDGYCDLVIGEPGYSGAEASGRVHVYYGGPDFDIIADLIFDGSNYGIISWGLQFGSNVDISGDFNGDGYNDLVVYSSHSNLFHYGQVNIFYGGPDLDLVCDWFYHGEMVEEFGTSLSVGDFNGDGFSDLITVSWFSSVSDTQIIKLFLGGSTFDNICDGNLSVLAPYQIIPLLMETDLNYDSYDDLIFKLGNDFYICWGSSTADLAFEIWHVAAPTNLRSCYYSVFDGLSYLCYGTPQLESFNFYRWDSSELCVLDYTINEPYNPHAGQQLSYYLGDINGDGHSEILLSNRITDSVLFKVFTTEDGSNLMDDYTIAPIPNLLAYPNPFIHSSLLSYELKEPGKVELFVYNIKGQLVAILEDGYRGIGKHSVNWDGRDQQGRRQATGIYLISLQLGQRNSFCKKVTLTY